MASSGSFNTSSYDGAYLQFNWSVASQSIANNTTTINWSLVGAGISSGHWYMAGNFYVSIEDQQVYFSSTRIKLYNGTTVASGTYTINHGTDGNKTFSAYAEAGIYTYAVNCTGSGSWSLPQITRKANLTSAPNFTDIQNPTINYSNPAGNNVTSLQTCIANTSGSIIYVSYRDISKTGTSYTFNLTEAERNTLRNATTNSNTLNLKFYIKTVIGGNTLYSTLDRTMTIVNANPTFDTVTYEDSNSTTTAITQNNQQIIQGKSSLTFNIPTAVAYKGASISSYTVTINQETKTANAGTFNWGIINANSNTNAVVTVTDSRGNKASQTIAITILSYELPYATLSAQRKNNYYSDTYITVNPTFSSLDDKNTITILVKYKKTIDTTYGSDNVIQPNVQEVFLLDNKYEWNVVITLQDKIGSTAYNIVIPKGMPIMFVDVIKNSLGINCFPQNEGSVESSGLVIDDNIYIGSQVLYDSYTVNSAGQHKLLGAYQYMLIQGLFTGMTIPEGYERAYRLTAQITTSNSNNIVVGINNMQTWGRSTWSASTYRIITSSRIFRESEITLGEVYGYESGGQQGLTLSVTSDNGYLSYVYNITLHAYLVKSTNTVNAIAEDTDTVLTAN